MPLKSTETVLAALMKQEVIAENSKRGLKPPDPKALDALTTGLSKAIIKHLLTNTEVMLGIPVSTSGGSGATSGPGKLA